MKTKKNTKDLPVRVAPSAQAISDQYAAVVAKTGEMLREAVKFGTMLLEWESFLGEARGGDGGGASEGLKGWLAKNCPEINYQTAMGYKHLAEKSVKMLGGGEMAIAVLADKSEVVNPDGEVIDVDAKVLEKRDELFATADSRRKLEQMYFDFAGGKGRPGRPKGTKAALGATLSKVESARRLWAALISQVVKGRAGLYSSAMLLPREEAEASLSELKALCDALKKRIDEEG